MSTVAIPNRLIGASYLFILKSESDHALALNEFIGKSFKRHIAEGTFQLGLDSETHTDTFMSKESRLRLDVEEHTHANVISIGLASFIDSDETPSWNDQVQFLDESVGALESAGIDVLGTTVVAIGNPQVKAESLDAFTTAVNEPQNHVSAKLGGNVIHQFIGNLNRQFFFIENFEETDLEEIVTDQLPGIVWAMQRLTREMSFFQDRLQTIETEKKAIDEDLSKIFHQKVGSTLDSSSAQVLEDQITHLSSMYSMMATDLHLVSDAVNTFDRDLTALEDRATEFGTDDADAFPRYRLATYRAYLKELRKHQSDFRLSLDNTKAAIDIAQTQTAILRGSQGLALQEQTRELLDQNLILQDERASLQAATSVVELVVVFYYSLVSWKTVAIYGTVDILTPWQKFSTVGIFAIAVVTLTHYVGASLHKKRIKWVPILISAGLVLATLVIMALLPATVADQADH